MSKIMYVDEKLAQEIAKIQSGGSYEYKRVKYDVVDNREVFNGKGLMSAEQYELVIDYQHTYFVAHYTKVGDLVNFTETGKEGVYFQPMVREVSLVYAYKQPKDAKDAFDPDKVVEITKKLVEGVAYVPLNDDYYWINQVVNRKNGTKIEVKVHKHHGIIGTKDIVNMEAFMQVMDKTHVVSYSIIFDVKENIPMMTIKIDIGIEKSDWKQQSLFEASDQTDKLEIISISENS